MVFGSFMRLFVTSFLASTVGASYYSYSSSSSSSSSVSTNGHSASTSDSNYREADSEGLDLHGGGTLKEADGAQVYETLENCNGGKCISSVDKTRHRPIRRIL